MVDARVMCVGSDTNRTLQTPTVARNTAPSAREERRDSDICLLITDTSPAAATHCDPDNNSIQRRMRLTLYLYIVIYLCACTNDFHVLSLV